MDLVGEKDLNVQVRGMKKQLLLLKNKNYDLEQRLRDDTRLRKSIHEELQWIETNDDDKFNYDYA